MPEPIFMKFGMYVMAFEPISVAYFINPSDHSVCLYVYLPIVARQRLDKNVTYLTYFTYLRTYLLTHSRSWALLEEPRIVAVFICLWLYLMDFLL
jgi:hypothetical protein